MRDTGAAGIEQRVPDGRAAAGHKNLMNLVGRGVKRGDEDGQEGPTQLPALPGRSDGAKEQHAKNEILDCMSAFADEIVQREQRLLARVRKNQDLKDSGAKAGILR